jgi:uncharacterized protein YcnI
MMKLVAVLACLAATNVAAHVTLVPNYGAGAGNYFQFAVKIPHGETHEDKVTQLETTKIEITVPHGVKTVKPEAVYGWDIVITDRPQGQDADGKPVDMGPAKITYTAKCPTNDANGKCANEDHGGLHNDHLMLLAMQIKLGCDFGVDATNTATNDATVWQGQHTLWWPVAQWTSNAGTNDGNTNDPADAYQHWSAVKQGAESWHTRGLSPSPYLFIYSDQGMQAACKDPQTGVVGMRWGVTGEVIPPAENQDPIKTKAEMLSMINEETFDLEEAMDVLQTDMDKRLADVEADKFDIKHCAIAAICIAGILMVAFITLCAFRVTKPAHFREYLLSAPLIQDNGHAGKTIEIGAV